MTQLTLALDHEPSLDKLARKMADEDIIYGEHRLGPRLRMRVVRYRRSYRQRHSGMLIINNYGPGDGPPAKHHVEELYHALFNSICALALPHRTSR